MKKQMKGLIVRFRGAGFFTLEDHYYTAGSDFPAVFTSFTDNGKTKKISDYKDAPETLHLLEKALDDIVYSEGWKPLKAVTK